MSLEQREKDLKMLDELLSEYVDQLKESEVESFASMRFDLKRPCGFTVLTDRQRRWVVGAYERLVPQYANLMSRGLAPRGKEVPTPPVLQNLPKKPPPFPGKKR